MSSVPPPERSDDQSAPSISDEQLESFLREAAEGGGAPAPKEPSARARMVAARLRDQEEPAPWRGGPQSTPARGSRDRRRRAGAVAGVLVLAAVAVVALRPSLVLDRLPGDDASAQPTLAAETARPTGAPANAAGSPQATREHPFAGSPAERWAEGADAIVVPEAKALSGLGKDDVAFALRRAKELLVAANLDPAVLRGERPDEALDVLDPKQPELLPKLRRSLSAPDADHDPLRLFTRFDPEETRLAGDVVKVRGRMTLAAGEPGVVKVDADYTFVYPLVRVNDEDGPVARTIIRREITLTLNDPARWNVTEGKLLMEKYFSEYGNTDCDVHDGYLHPGFPDDAGPGGARPTGPSTDPYDRSRPVTGSEPGDCGQVTRT
ncbi:hypothetical protein [Streptomyces ardesiacus]|uniref:hypothetical protein n=1 Tax=Streptomyces ardesiacus TaxID=285564 RepID=UPI00201E944B|nr:hypothetical protein [Streptomyces ardesiacus]MCL7366203.1 hypothetical protein [Streptomyces ardesiacus]